MASIREKIKAALFSNATLSIAWGLALFANTALVAIGLVNKDVPGTVAAMLGAIAAALMIFSIFLREKADAEDEDEAEPAAQASSATADNGEEDGDTIVEELLAEIELETAAQASSETATAAAAVGSAKSGEAEAGEE